MAAQRGRGGWPAPPCGIQHEMDRARLPYLRGSLARLGWPSGGGRYGFVSTALNRKDSIAPFASSGAFGLVLHWPFFGPDVNLGTFPAP